MRRKLLVLLIAVCLACSACGRKSKEELLAEGIRQLDGSNPGGAVVLFKSALEKDENFLEARFQLARSYSALGKYEQAEKEFQKVLKQNPARDEILIELAKIYNATKRGDQAFALGERYVAKHPGSVEGLEVLGIASAVAGRYDHAERYLLQALAVDGSRAATRLELAGVYAAAGKEAVAKQVLEELVQASPRESRAYHMLAAIEKKGGNSDRALEIYRRAVAANPSDTLAAYRMGMIFLEKGDLKSADSTADGLIKNYPKRADGHRLKGLVYYQRRQYAEAITSLQNSIRIAPTLEAYYFMGLCHYGKGELESSLSQFRVILDRVPTSRQARLMTATVLLAQKRTDDAITEIRKVLLNDDRDAVAHNLLGNAYMAKGMFDEGMRELNRATSIDPKIVDAYLKKGYFYFSHGKNELGESELATAVKAAPDALNGRLLLASYYLRSGSASKALSLLKAGLNGRKGDALLYNSIAAVQLSQNRTDEALQSIQKAKQVDPAFPASYQNLATYYAASGRYDKAIDEYTALLRVDSRNLRALLGLAALHEIRGNDREALAFYDRATATGQPAAYLTKANYLLKKRETGKAIKVVDELLKTDPRNQAALEMKGRMLMNAKEYKQAVKVFDEVEALNPDAGVALKIGAYVAMRDTTKAVSQARILVDRYPRSAKGYLVLASVYEGLGDRARAVAEVKNGLRVEPGNAEALLRLGNLLEASRDYGQAMATYAEAARNKPDFVPAIFAQGALLDGQGKKKEAVEKYRAVLAKSDSYVPALNNLAYLYASGYGSSQEALRLAITAFKLEPGNAGIMDTLGFALLRNRRLDDAAKVLEKAVSLLPNNPTVTYHLAQVYAEKGDRNRALGFAQKALSQGDFADAPAARTLVASLRKR